jgi:hypothetical protein
MMSARIGRAIRGAKRMNHELLDTVACDDVENKRPLMCSHTRRH